MSVRAAAALIGAAVVASGALPAFEAHAQSGSVAGFVRDAATQRPLAGATIGLLGTTLEARSRDNGGYLLLGVPPGTYSVSIRFTGYAPREVAGVVVRLGQTTRLDTDLDSARALPTIRIDADPPPPIDPRAVSAGVALTTQDLRAYPATSITEVLTLAPGFGVLGEVASLQSLSSQRRGDPAQISVRGARSGSTVLLVDGLSVNSPVFGSTAIEVNPLALSSLTFSPGYMDAQYGGGSAGVVNMTLREGGDLFRASMDYQSSTVPGALGALPDAVSRTHNVRGFAAGPVPVAPDHLRFMLAWQVRTTRERVVQFPAQAGTGSGGFGRPGISFSGWHGFGGVDDDQIIGKLTFSPHPATKLSVVSIGQSRRVVPYDQRYLGLYRELTQPATPPQPGETAEVSPYLRLTQESVRQRAWLFHGRFEQRFDWALLSLSHGHTGGERTTCSVLHGVCLGDRFWRASRLSNGTFNPEVAEGIPVTATGLHFGGERYASHVSQVDVVVQSHDHLRLQAGAQWTRHDLTFREVASLPSGVGHVPTATNLYRASPSQVAGYAQATVDYDFLLATFGLRIDRHSAPGTGLMDPMDATAGTTAREVCQGTAPGINEVPFHYQELTGLPACLSSPSGASGLPVLLDSAARLAQADDFRPARRSAVLAPRIAVSFPLSERSSLFVNAGQYTKHPYYHDLFRNTGTGTVAGFGDGADNLCHVRAAKPGTSECPPVLVFHPDLAEHVGNPNLRSERSTLVEVGYSARVDRGTAIGLTAYAVEHGALTGLLATEVIDDPGLTYSPLQGLQYSMIRNTDHVTSRGATVSVYGRFARYFAFNANYTWSRTTEVGEPPELAAEKVEREEAGVALGRAERVSARDRPHAVNFALFAAWPSNPDVPFGTIGARIAANSRFAVTYSWTSASGSGQLGASGSSGGGSSLPVAGLEFTPSNPVNVMYAKDVLVRSTRIGAFVRATNVFNSRACCGGLYTLEERRLLAAGLPVTAPDDRTQLRRVLAGLDVVF